MGVPVVVRLPDGDDAGVGSHGREEPGCVRGAAVVRHLQDVGAQAGRPLEQPALRDLLDVTGKQQPAARVVDA